MRFDGIAEWSRDIEPIIELDVGGLLLDIHNWAEFVSLSWDVPDWLHVCGRFDHAYAQRLQLPQREFELRFSSVRNLHVEQADDFDVREAPDIEGFLFIDDDAKENGDTLEAEVGGLVLRFQTDAVFFSWHDK